MEETDFKEILEEFLLIRQLTQSSFAATVGIKQSQVSEWLRGKAKPGYDMLKRISLAFGVSADYFLGISEKFD